MGALDRVINWSSKDKLAENVHNLMRSLGRMHFDVAVKWTEALERGELRDEAYAGLAAGLSVYSKESDWKPLWNLIENAETRQRTTNNIDEIKRQIEAMKK